MRFPFGFLKGGVPPLAQYTAYYNALPNKPSAALQAAQNKFLVDLGAPLRARMKTGYFYTDSLGNAKINMVNPAQFTLTVPAGEPTFLANNGVISGGTQYYNQPFTSTQSAGIESDLTAIQYMASTNVSDANSAFSHGMNGALSEFFGLAPKGFTDLVTFYSFTNAGPASAANANHKGLYVLSGDASNQFIWKDGVKTTAARALVPFGNTLNRFILCYNANGVPTGFYGSSYVACDFLFDRFADADELTFRNAWNTYKASAGIP